MTKSILQTDRTHCFICGMNTNVEPLDCHHVFNSFNKKNSEKYGLLVWLHHRKCHIFGENSVHGNAKVDKKLKAFAQKKAMEHYGWSIEQFRELFGKNYL